MKRPQDGYSASEAAAAAGVLPRTLVHWASEGLFKAPPFRGPYTRYSDDHIAQLKAIRRLREAGLGLAAIHDHIAEAAEWPPAEPASDAPPPPPEHSPPVMASRIVTPPVVAPLPLSAELWERIALFPGLELHVNRAGGELVRRLAEEIRGKYGVGEGGDPPRRNAF